MKKILVIFLSTILLTWGVSSSPEVFALSVKEEKQEIINQLEDLKEDSKSKKSEKRIESAIKQIGKGLDEKFWKEESSLNIKYGKKVLNSDKNAVNKLEKILKDKKESHSSKEQISEIIQKIAEIDKVLVENAIKDLEDIEMSDKGLKKLNKASKFLDAGNEFLENGKFLNAIKSFEKAWEQIKKTLKDPHFKKMKMVELEGTLDMNFDGIPDAHLKIVDPEKKNKPKEINLKITGECVNGISHDDARMKIGVSVPDEGPGHFPLEFFDEEIHATNKWFKKNDPNKKIDPVIISTVSEYFSFPESGDDLIQKNSDDKKGSFEFMVEPISEIGEQSGWEGKFTLDAEPGDYALHFWFPLTEPTIEGDSCNFVSSFSVPTTFDDKIVKQIAV